MTTRALMNLVRMPFRRICLILAVFLTWGAARGASEAQADGLLQAKVKAAYVFNFIKFVDWPQAEGQSSGEPIRIGVIGNDPVADLLFELSGRQVKGRLLVVESYSPAMNRTLRCQILFISQGVQQRLPQILQKIPATGVLTVSDIANFSSRGGVIGFIAEDGRVKIEINIQAARQASLKISAKLLEVSRVIQ